MLSNLISSVEAEGCLQMARKSKKKKWARRAELKLRLPEPLRLNLELAARRAGRSMNAEAVQRLSESVLGNSDPYAIAAEAILNGLHDRIVTIIEDMILRANADEEVRALYRKDAEQDLASERPSFLGTLFSRVPSEPSDLAPEAPEPRRRALGTRRAQPRSAPGQEPELPVRRPPPPGDRSLSDAERRLLIRAEELAAQGRTRDAATVRFMVGRPLPRPLPQYLIDLLGQELLDLLDQPELPMPQPRGRQAK